MNLEETQEQPQSHIQSDPAQPAAPAPERLEAPVPGAGGRQGGPVLPRVLAPGAQHQDTEGSVLATCAGGVWGGVG